MRKKHNKATFIFVFIFIYIIFLGLYTIFTTFAKYTDIVGKSKSIAVAKWNVSILEDEYHVLPTMVIGDSGTYQDYNFSITSTSEIAAIYSVVISNVPTGVLVRVDDDVIYSEDNNTISIPNLGSFSANDINTTHNHKLTFMAPIGVETIDNQVLDLDVIITQVSL